MYGELLLWDGLENFLMDGKFPLSGRAKNETCASSASMRTKRTTDPTRERLRRLTHLFIPSDTERGSATHSCTASRS